MLRSRSFGLFACLSLLACGPGRASDGITNDSTDEAETSDASTGSPTTSTSTGDGDGEPDPSETDTGEPHVFVPDEDFGACSACDTIAQDCPEGEKCVPGPELGGSGECGPPACFPIVGDKLPGEPCTFDGHVDDCDENSWCYPAKLELEGPAICIEFCGGTYDDPTCSNPDEVCVFDRHYYWGDLGCRPRCNPLMPEGCGPGESCTLGSDGYQTDFGCTVAPAEAMPGEPCEENQECNAGLCVDILELPECAGESCCASFCDMLQPDCPVGTECVQVELADNPESTVGVCKLPS